ncbi:MAG: DUF4465 domain-containing protein [Bacteroidetes bacterium]|nr:DUF4465 domain-containing protein [Bacteroidota bacterium]HET6242976.1 DUF4465 domain-containing protein [Bacteroidia bacterium]
MKTRATQLILFKILMSITVYSNAQTVSDYENLSLNADSYWEGSDLSQGFNSGNAFFTNTFDLTWGGYWSEGFAYSNMKDSTTAGFTNLYSARTASGYYNSANYAIGMDAAVIHLKNAAKGGIVNGMYVTNSTYAAISMLQGDAIGKQFGSIYGANGDIDGTQGKDWYKLSITGFYNNAPINDTVDFYLADYRFSNASQNYIVTTWEWVNLESLGNLDSLIFHLSSSDNGDWGMNTPGYFCVDDFTTMDSPLLVENHFKKNLFAFYPNPAGDQLNVSFTSSNYTFISIRDLAGRELFKENIENTDKYKINVSGYPSGAYIIEVSNSDHFIERTIFIKN